jgi:acetyltransferase-like isoleucine patch superfamily enzyme
VAVEIADRGERNRIVIAGDVLADGTGTITLDGDDNEVVIEPACILSGARITLGSRCTFRAGNLSRLNAVEVYARADGHVTIGTGNYFTWHTRLYLHEPGRIVIGNDCGIASGTLLTVSDMHPIYDRTSGERINAPRDVTVEDQVWISQDAALLKGAQVGRGSVIALRAVVTGAIPAHCIAAGVPARVIRENIRWDV